MWQWQGVGKDRAQEQPWQRWQELFHWREEEGEKSTCRRKSGLTLERPEFRAMYAEEEGCWVWAVNSVDHCEEVRGGGWGGKAGKWSS